MKLSSSEKRVLKALEEKRQHQILTIDETMMLYRLQQKQKHGNRRIKKFYKKLAKITIIKI